MHTLPLLIGGSQRWLNLGVALVFLSWLASALLLGLDAGLSWALQGTLLGGNLLRLALAWRAQRRQAAALHRTLDQLDLVRALTVRGAPRARPGRYGQALRRGHTFPLIHDN